MTGLTPAIQRDPNNKTWLDADRFDRAGKLVDTRTMSKTERNRKSRDHRRDHKRAGRAADLKG